jgi:hypothetical protein
MTNKEQCVELAHLIRKGSKKAPQTTCGRLFAFSNGSYTTCALGAALDALDLVVEVFDTEPQYKFLKQKFPVLEEIIPDRKGLYLIDHIEIKNDQDHNTRESIADWLESLEWKD